MSRALAFAARTGCLLATVLVAPGVAQQKPALDTSARLHAAWLREMLDLDVSGAVQEYEAIAADPRTVNLERWIAVARLVELHRVGVPLTRPVPVAEAPEPIRTAVGRLQPVNVASVLAAPPVPDPVESPVDAPVSIDTDEPRPDLRPLVDVAVRWFNNQQGSGFRDRNPNNRQRPPADTSERFAAFNAFDVLWRELQGKQEQANELRRLYFANWKPPVVRGEPGDLLIRVRTNLDAWLADTALSSQQRERLRYLREQLESDPVNKLAMVQQRLPRISERLLAEPPGK